MEHVVNQPMGTLSAADQRQHERDYRKFVTFARSAAIALPFFVAFVLYWTQ